VNSNAALRNPLTRADLLLHPNRIRTVRGRFNGDSAPDTSFCTGNDRHFSGIAVPRRDATTLGADRALTANLVV
jgi:hypothetical protein